MTHRLTSQQTPWHSPESLYLAEPIVLGTSKRAYFRWLATVIIALCSMGLAYGYYSVMPRQVEFQIVLSLMIGVSIWVIVRWGELYVRRVEIDFNGLRLRTLFHDEQVAWNQIKRIEWWRRPDADVLYTNYRIQSEAGQTLAAFSDSSWNNLLAGVGYIAAATRLAPVRIKPPFPEMVRVAAMIMAPLAILMFSIGSDEPGRAIGFVLIRLFWAILVLHYTHYELRIARFYLTLLSLAVIAALIFIAGATLWQTLLLLLYTPLLEIVVSWLVFRIRRYLKNRREVKPT